MSHTIVINIAKQQQDTTFIYPEWLTNISSHYRRRFDVKFCSEAGIILSYKRFAPLFIKANKTPKRLFKSS